ncbi:winged helix-turn-helix domain-containing protein [Serratia aquatilis]|uniref:Transcriptional regulator n=1 Tax=Serratia aquatilis TaxID=1737515 RepID=A0ABV6EH50_9GAMM
MSEKYIINYKVIFIPAENRLTPLEARGSEIILNAPVSRILLLLLQNAGEVVRQEELFKEVWEKHGQFVSANTLYQNVSLLRKGLNHTGLLTDIVRTVPKRGFIFKGEVQIYRDNDKPSQPENNNNQSINTAINNEPIAKEIHNQTIDHTESKVVNKNSADDIFIKKWKGIKLVPLICFSFFLIASVLIWTKKEDKFISTHNKIASINQCAIYVDQGNLRASYEKYILFLEEKKVACDPTKFIYITKKIASNDVLILLCNTEISGDVNCSTLYKMTQEK